MFGLGVEEACASPARRDGLVLGLRAGDGRLAGALLVDPQPDLGFARVVCAQPRFARGLAPEGPNLPRVRNHWGHARFRLACRGRRDRVKTDDVVRPLEPSRAKHRRSAWKKRPRFCTRSNEPSISSACWGHAPARCYAADTRSNLRAIGIGSGSHLEQSGSAGCQGCTAWGNAPRRCIPILRSIVSIRGPCRFQAGSRPSGSGPERCC